MTNELDAVVRQMPRGDDGSPITMSGHYWYIAGSGLEPTECGVLAIIDPDERHWEDYPEGERWRIRVRTRKGDEYELTERYLYSTRDAAMTAAAKSAALAARGEGA